MKLCVVGTGYVGLVSGTCFAEVGNEVICVDNLEKKIEGLKNGIMPIYEPGLKEMVERNYNEGRLKFTTDLDSAVKASDVIFIAVGTPAKESGEADLSQVKEVTGTIAKSMNGYKIIVNKSTVPVGTGKWVKKLIQRVQTQYPFSIVSNPEFLREGSAIYDTMNTDRVVIGADEDKAAEVIVELHKPFNAPMVVTDIESAEMIKYASNSFLATKISFINEMSNLCEKVGADVTKVAEGMGLDKRIGKQFLNAGIGFGGACFPKDVKALIAIARQNNLEFNLLQEVISTNNYQRKHFVQKLEQVVGNFTAQTFGILGLAFKPNTDDMREAPSIDIVSEIVSKGGRVKAYDPIAMDLAKEIMTDVEFCSSAYETCENVDALLLLTEWDEFRELEFERIKGLMKSPVIIDGRNLWKEKELNNKGFVYKGTGL